MLDDIKVVRLRRSGFEGFYHTHKVDNTSRQNNVQNFHQRVVQRIETCEQIQITGGGGKRRSGEMGGCGSGIMPCKIVHYSLMDGVTVYV